MRDTSDYPILNAAVEGVGTRQPKEERFLSPGTWTRPSTVNWVQVIVVGGGGGGSVAPAPPTPLIAQSGGGGGVRIGLVPVSAPVPITVGAGGTGEVWPAGALATAGGTTSFGPLTPPIPANTFSVGGGGAGLLGPRIPAPLLPTATNGAPPDGGGSGGFQGPTFIPSPGRAGRYGGPATPYNVPGASVGSAYGGSAGGWSGYVLESPGSTGIGYAPIRPSGRFGFGGGGGSIRHGGGEFATPPTAPVRNGVANTGGGAAGTSGAAPSGAQPGGTGGSGIVIVRYWE